MRIFEKTIDFTEYDINSDFNEYLDSNYSITVESEQIASISEMIFLSDSPLYFQILENWKNERREVYKNLLEEINQISGNSARLNKLFQSLSHGQTVPFIGAGVSIQCGLPGWREFLVKQKENISTDKQKAFETAYSQYNLERCAQILNDGMGKHLFIEKIHEAFGREPMLTGALRVLNQLEFETIITTNFDRLLEAAFHGKKNRFSEIIRGSEIPDRLTPGKTLLFKLHGDYNYERTRVFLEDEYKSSYYNSKMEIDLELPLPQILQTLFSSKTFLFMGCSLYEDSTLKVFKKILSKQRTLTEHYCLHEFIEDRDTRIERERFLTEHRIFPIWYPAGEYASLEAILYSAKKYLK